VKKYIFLFLISVLFLFGCAENKVIRNAETEDEKAPVMIWITKTDGSSPMNVQVSNTTKVVLVFLKIELSLKDTLSRKTCKVALDIISERFSALGLEERTFLNPNATNMFVIGFDEFEKEPCWGEILKDWSYVRIGGKILDIKFAPQEE